MIIRGLPPIIMIMLCSLCDYSKYITVYLVAIEHIVPLEERLGSFGVISPKVNKISDYTVF